ncbi:formate--tetrahydrofolate ligase [Nesterenkonia natronophila]|uniref:Formate--tetrahydrofolate ligase n=1 Tax=Nesterenkonia natronophila TaxID=2174932 RepID=A0A3A4F8Y4_9MICC|nr:formate--tetrahydrofolate ligase [Nesterenkonia natronophila]RJN31667.1 formate--tetrahydrofolate ligase [Nesterenkonia natronophila]
MTNTSHSPGQQDADEGPAVPLTAQDSLGISARTQLRPIHDIGAELGLDKDLIEPYGRGVGKVDLAAIDRLADRPRAKYILVTAITPTPLGEGKTTTAVGLGQGLQQTGRRAAVAVRQPSLGPTLGIKGGGTGGGWSQVVPMERLNLHLTGDLHAVTAAHNQLAAMVDNHLHRGSPSGLQPERVTWRRVMDVNDRSLRQIITGMGPAGGGPSSNGPVRQSGFDITAASEVMATLSLARSLEDLRSRLGRIVVGTTGDGKPVTAEDIKAAGAMTVLLREALQPNLLQTVEHTPALVHCGPFGNIATGNSSVVADLIGARTTDYLITEAGFAADMGAERFFNIKCRVSGLEPDAAVVVTTVRALKVHSGHHRVVAGKSLPERMREENPEEVRTGAENLRAQLRIIRRHGVTPVVAINAFPTDFTSEHEVIAQVAAEEGARCAVSTHFSDGGAGAAELAEAVAEAAEEPGRFRFLYSDEAPLIEKIETIATEIYGADGVEVSPTAAKDLASFTEAGYGRLPVCVAKTHLSMSADPKLVGAPTGWRLPVREVRLSAGAGFVYPICGTMQTMPGLGASPAAENIDIDDDGRPVGLF